MMGWHVFKCTFYTTNEACREFLSEAFVCYTLSRLRWEDAESFILCHEFLFDVFTEKSFFGLFLKLVANMYNTFFMKISRHSWGRPSLSESNDIEKLLIVKLMKNFNMKLPVEKGPGYKAEPGEPHGTSRKRPRSTHASGPQVVVGANCLGPLRPPSRARVTPSALGWGSHLHCAPQISIPDSRLHLTASNRPRSRFNSVRNFS